MISYHPKNTRKFKRSERPFICMKHTSMLIGMVIAKVSTHSLTSIGKHGRVADVVPT